MGNWLVNYFSVKNFTDEDKNRKNRILYILWLSYWILFTVLFSLGLFFAKNFIGVALLFIITSIYLFIVGLFRIQGRIKEASLLFIAFSWFTFSAFSFVAGGILNIISSFFIALIIITGILLGRKSAIFVFIVSSAVGLTYIVINTSYYTLPQLFKPNNFNDWLLFNFVGFFILVPTLVYLRELEYSLNSTKESEIKYKDLSENLEKLIEDRTSELEKSNRNLKYFTYVVTHDFKSNLTKIENFSSLLESQFKDQYNDEQIAILSKLKSNSKNIKTQFEDLMTYFKLIDQPLAKTNVDMNNLVTDVVALFTDEIDQHNVKILINSLDSCRGDATLLLHVWANLLSNAIKYTNDQSTPQIEIGQINDSTGATYFVKDNGIGFDNKFSSKLFNEFERLHSDSEGSGLGLALCKRIIDSHGGEIWANSEINSGSTFYFKLNRS